MRAGAAGGRIAELQRQLAAQQAAAESGQPASASSPQPRKLNLTANSLLNSSSFNPAAQLSPGAKPPTRKSTEDESTNGDNVSSSSSSSSSGGAMVHAHRAKSKSPRRAPINSKPAFSANPTHSNGEEGTNSLLATPVKPTFHTEAASPASAAFLSEPLGISKSPSRSNSYTDEFNMLTSPLDEIGNTPMKDPSAGGDILPHSHTPFDAAVQNTPFDKTPFDDSEEINSSSQISSPFKLNTSTTKSNPVTAYGSAAASNALAQAAARAKAEDEEKAKLERQKSEEAAKRSAEIERLRAQVELDKRKAEKARQDALEARQALEQEESLRTERAAAEAEKAAAAERNRIIAEAAKAKEEKEKEDRAKAIAEQHRRNASNASAASSPRSPEREREREDNEKEDKMAALGMLDFSAPAAATPAVVVTPATAPAAATKPAEPAPAAAKSQPAAKKHSKAETPESSLLGASTRRKQSVSLSLSASLELSDDDDTDDVLSDDLELDDGDSLNAAPKKRVQPPPLESTPAKPAAKAAVPPAATTSTTTAAPSSSSLTVPAATPSAGLAGYDPSPSRPGTISASPSSIVPPTFTGSPSATPQRLSNANAADVLSTGDHELDALLSQSHDIEVDFAREEAEEKDRQRLAEQRVREATERVERSMRGEKDTDSQSSAGQDGAVSLSSPAPAAAPEKQQLSSPLAPSTPSLSVHNSSLNTSTLSGQTVPSPALSVVGSSPSSNVPLAASALAALSPSHPYSAHPSTSETNAALQQAAPAEPELPLTEEQRVERDRALAAQKRAAVKAQLDMMRGIPPQPVESSPSQKPVSADVNGTATGAAPLDLTASEDGEQNTNNALSAAAATTAAESSSYMLDLTSPQTANTSMTSTTSSTSRQLSWHQQAAALARAAVAPPKRKTLPPPKTASEGVALVRQKKKEEEARKKAAIEAARALAPHLSTEASTVQEPTKAFKQLQKETSIQLATLDKQAIKAKKDAAYAARFDKESGMFQPTVVQPFSAETMADTKAAIFKRKRKGEPSLGSMNEMQEAQLRNLDFGPPPAEDEVQTGRDLFGIPMPATTSKSSAATKKKKKGVASKAPKFHSDSDEKKQDGGNAERPRYMSPKSKSQKDLRSKSGPISSRSQPMSRSASAKSSAANSLANTATSLKIDVSSSVSKKGVGLGFGSSSPSRGGSRSNSTKKTIAGFSPSSSSSLPAHLDESVKRLSAPRSASNSTKKGASETIHERKQSSSSQKKGHSRAASSAHDEALVALLSRPTSAAAARTAQTVKVTPVPSSNFAFGARTSTSRELQPTKSARMQREVAKSKTAEGVTIPAPFNMSKVKSVKVPSSTAGGAASARGPASARGAAASSSSSSVSSPSAAKRPLTAAASSKIPLSARSNAASTTNSAAVSRSGSRKATKTASNTSATAARPKTAGAAPSAATADAKKSHIPVKKPASASKSSAAAKQPVSAKQPASARTSLSGKKKESSTAATSSARPSTAAPVARRPSSGKPSSEAASTATPAANSSTVSSHGPSAAPPAGAVMKSKKQLQAEAAAAAASSGAQPASSASPVSPAPSVPSSANASGVIAVGSSGSAFSPVSPTPSPGVAADRPSPMLGSSRGASISIPTSPTPVNKNSLTALNAHHQSSQSKDSDLPPIEGPGLLDFFNQSEEPQPPAVDGNVRVSGSSAQPSQQQAAPPAQPQQPAQQQQQPTTAAAIVAAIVRDVNAMPAPVSVNSPVSPAAAASSPAVIVSPPAASPTGSEPASASPSAVHDGEEFDEEEAEERRLAEIRKAKLASSKIKLGPIAGEISAGGPNAAITPRSSIIKRPSSASIGNANDGPAVSPTASTASLAGAKKTVTMPTSILKTSSSSSNANGSPVSSSAPSVSFVPGTATGAPSSSSSSFSFSTPASSIPSHHRAPSSHALLRRRFEHERLLVEMAEVFAWLKAIVGEAEMEGAGPVAAAAAKRIEITQPLQPDALFAAIENGAILCALVSHCQASAHMGRGNAANDALVLNTPPITFKADARVGSFVARDNLSNFLTIMSNWGLSRDRLFEVDDLVLRKNDKQVIQSLLDISRMCFAKFGITPPAIVQMEIDIQKEEEAPPPPPPPMPELPPLPPLPPVEDPASNEPSAPKPPRYLPYIPVPGDKLDEAVADLVNGQQIDLCIRRAKTGAYYIGDLQDPKVHFVRLVRHLLLVRVGGGWESFAETAQRKFEAQATEEAKLLQQQQQQPQP